MTHTTCQTEACIQTKWTHYLIFIGEVKTLDVLNTCVIIFIFHVYYYNTHIHIKIIQQYFSNNVLFYNMHMNFLLQMNVFSATLKLFIFYAKLYAHTIYVY